MIICDTHNFNFVRIPKNASSSLAHFFVKNYCTSTDKYTEVNDSGIKSTNVPKELIVKYKDQYRFIHLTMQELIDNNIISKENALSYENIGVLRNPFERQLSLFFFLQRQSADKSIATFRTHFINGHHFRDGSNSILQTEYLNVDGKDIGTWWIYEDLNKSVAEFVTKKDIPLKADLPTFKSSMKPKQDIFNEYYDKKTQDAVRMYYEKDFSKYAQLTGIAL